MIRISKLFFSLSFKQKKMVFEAFVLSAYYRFLILYIPFSKLSPKIGTVGFETPKNVTERDTVLSVRTIAEAVCRHTPWESKCLVRALTAKKLLNRLGYACTLYMGVKRTNGGTMDAHAWLRCGDIYVTGGTGAGYAVTGIFGDNI